MQAQRGCVRVDRRLAGSGRSEQAGAPPRILGLTSSSCRPSDANARLLGTLRRACELCRAVYGYLHDPPDGDGVTLECWRGMRDMRANEQFL